MKVFISHAKENNSIVRRIITKLDDNGIKNWSDIEKLNKVDSDINASINEGLATSNYFLLVWSIHASHSEYVKKEYNATISSDYDSRLRKIIIRLDDALLPPLLSDKKYHTSTEEDLDDVLDGIIIQIKEPEKDFENTKRFDDDLNSVYDDVEIAGITYPTSVALKKIDPVMYDELKQAWITSMEESEQ